MGEDDRSSHQPPPETRLTLVLKVIRDAETWIYFTELQPAHRLTFHLSWRLVLVFDCSRGGIGWSGSATKVVNLTASVASPCTSSNKQHILSSLQHTYHHSLPFKCTKKLTDLGLRC